MRALHVFGFVVVFCALIPALSLSATESPQIIAPERIERGYPFQVLLHPAPATGIVRVSLETETGRRVAAAPAFNAGSVRDTESSIALLGVPSTAHPGRYRLRVEYRESANGPLRVRYREIEVVDRVYHEMTIALDQAMSSLRTSTDPRRYRETRELMELLEVFRADARFMTGEMMLPVDPDKARVSARFGDRREFVYTDGERAGTIHFGLDLAAPIGTPVYASAAGRVAFAGDRLITGYSIVIEHLPGVYGLYYHLDSLETETGALVRKGDLIGTVGATGLVTGPHLHWEIRVNGVPVEPEWFLSETLLDTHRLFGMIETR